MWVKLDPMYFTCHSNVPEVCRRGPNLCKLSPAERKRWFWIDNIHSSYINETWIVVRKITHLLPGNPIFVSCLRKLHFKLLSILPHSLPFLASAWINSMSYFAPHGFTRPRWCQVHSKQGAWESLRPSAWLGRVRGRFNNTIKTSMCNEPSSCLLNS